jgi:hypothetical protein
MSSGHYPAPVDKLLTYGDCRKAHEWPDYLALGLKSEHTHPRKPTWLDKFRLPDLDEEDVEAPRPVLEDIRHWNEKVEAERREKAQMKEEQAQRREEKKRHRRKRT